MKQGSLNASQVSHNSIDLGWNHAELSACGGGVTCLFVQVVHQHIVGSVNAWCDAGRQQPHEGYRHAYTVAVPLDTK